MAKSKELTLEQRRLAHALTLADMVDRLNSEHLKIGAGMMITMQEEARQVLLLHKAIQTEPPAAPVNTRKRPAQPSKPVSATLTRPERKTPGKRQGKKYILKRPKA